MADDSFPNPPAQDPALGSPTGKPSEHVAGNGVPAGQPAAAAPAPRRSLWGTLFGPAPSTGQPTDSVREVVETIVFVVVLVLMLKSFAAEAFVIPTGSMAETLWGYQKVVECPDCGIKFPVNCSQEVDPSEGLPQPITGCTCPNCRQRIQFADAGGDPRLRPAPEPGARQIRDPGWSSGDRVLVAKFVYDLFDRLPDRLDVVVFKYPGDNRFPQTGPHKNYVPMNYIKRCVGMPRETIAIHGGNLYVLDAEHGIHYDDYEEAKQDPNKMAVLWKLEKMHIDDAVQLFRQGKFTILRKPPEQILSTMRLVYDNDHPAKNQPVRWKGDGWVPAQDNSFQIEGGEQMQWLHYEHLLRGSGGRPSLITDFLGYNTAENHKLPSENWVNDLVLECEVTLDKPEGELVLELCRGVDRFSARWDLSSGVCSLWRDGDKKPLDSKPTALRKKGSYRLRFANVDERLTVWVDGSLPFEQGVTYTPPQQTGPRERNDLEPAGVGARGASARVRKLKLFRDLYYTTGGENAADFNPNASDVPNVVFTDPGTWDALSNMPVRTYYVQPEHFLCLGDNSQESSDGRSWGLVPRRLMLGRALMVYYPFGRAGRIR